MTEDDLRFFIFETILEVCSDYGADYHALELGDVPYAFVECNGLNYRDSCFYKVFPECIRTTWDINKIEQELSPWLKEKIEKHNANFVKTDRIEINQTEVVIEIFIGKIEGYIPVCQRLADMKGSL